MQKIPYLLLLLLLLLVCVQKAFLLPSLQRSKGSDARYADAKLKLALLPSSVMGEMPLISREKN